MANPADRHPSNVPGPWFVDRSCIDCDVSRQCAPWMFEESDGQSVVVRQPATEEERRDAARAMLACPTGSIGVVGEKPSMEGLFPEHLEEGVHYCGFTHRSSFGANAYFVRRPGGNLLVDSPRFVPPLVRAFEEAGGLAHLLLTHRDDVADAKRFADRFGARVWIHEDDADAARFATDLLRGPDPTSITSSLTAIPVPGHTKGSVVFLLEGRFLFTGDSLHWSRTRRRLSAFRDACWYSWEEQTRSLARLVEHPFEWVLPGHGNRAKGPPGEWSRQLLALVREMKRDGGLAEW
ncbi:MAG TPA: MBL fold metallo-hydrolase [Planctomycetota bacterium]|nr:MBL fold metallo-hydrolase [Planctomycetota bacterium]